MSYLVDTNAWIMFFEDSPRLSLLAADVLESPAACFISIASVWEAAIKVALGKLRLPYDLRDDLPRIIEDNGFRLLPVDLDDATSVCHLPLHHGDPFDRLMAAQAMRRNLRIISSDASFDKYGLRRIW